MPPDEPTAPDHEPAPPPSDDDADEGRAVSETSRTTGGPGQPDYGGGELGQSGDFGGQQSAGLFGEGPPGGEAPPR